MLTVSCNLGLAIATSKHVAGDRFKDDTRVFNNNISEGEQQVCREALDHKWATIRKLGPNQLDAFHGYDPTDTAGRSASMVQRRCSLAPGQ